VEEEVLRSISIDPEKCTGCGACALKCPREAIYIQDEGFVRKLIFEPQKCDFCLGIPICLSICPENAIEVVERPLSTETVELEFEIMPCAECGKPTGITKKEILRIIKKLGGRSKEYVPLCKDCRILKSAEGAYEW